MKKVKLYSDDSKIKIEVEFHLTSVFVQLKVKEKSLYELKYRKKFHGLNSDADVDLLIEETLKEYSKKMEIENKLYDSIKDKDDGVIEIEEIEIEED
jgi:hypothetical protein